MLNISITPISYEQAASMLNVTYNGIWKATNRGVFTRIPTVGHEQKLIKEQVELFKGKSQLRKDKLTSVELIQWSSIENIIISPPQNLQQEQTHDDVDTNLDELIQQYPHVFIRLLKLLKHLDTYLIPTIKENGEINNEEKKTYNQQLIEASMLFAIITENDMIDDETIKEHIHKEKMQKIYMKMIVNPILEMFSEWLDKQPTPIIKQVAQQIQNSLIPV